MLKEEETKTQRPKSKNLRRLPKIKKTKSGKKGLGGGGGGGMQNPNRKGHKTIKIKKP